jgi:hypothetical protein
MSPPLENMTGKQSSTTPASIDDRRHRVGVVLGVVVLTMVAIMYLGASYYAIRPAGHPLSGMIWCIVGFVILRTSIRRQRVPQWFYYVWAALVIIGMVLWLAATIGLIRM